MFCRQFVSMLRAGVSIVEALDMLSIQTENKTLSQAIREVRTEIGKGSTLSEAMEKQNKVFPPMLVNMVEAGETSGSIDKSLERMAIQFEKEAKLKGMMKRSMMYPMVLGVVALVILVVMLTYVIPNYMEMFDGYDFEMPALTLAIMHMGDFVKNHAILLVAIIVAIVIGIKSWKKTESGQEFFGTRAIKIPVFKNLNIKTYSSVFARTLSTLMQAGIPMIDAVDSVANTMTNILYKRELLKAKEEIAKGVPLSEPLKNGGLFPPMVVHMMAIGEETGEIEEMLDKLADYYDEEVEVTTQTVLALLEPMIIVFMAILAGVLAPQFVKYIGRSRISTDIQNAQQIATAISAEFADTARTTAVAEQTITDGKAKWDGDTDAASTARTQKEVFGGVPKVKAASGNFKYSVSADGEVTVKVGDTQLYPEAEGDWAK